MRFRGIINAFVLLASTLLFNACQPYKEAENIPKPIETVAFGSCAKQWEKQPIWTSINNDNPDLFLFIGDAIYGDWDGNEVFDITEETLSRDYAKLDAIPEFKKFKAHHTILATWDNHDYGKHNGGREFDKKELAKHKFLDFFDEPDTSFRYQTPGIYEAYMYGPDQKKTQIILLDTRWFKSPFKMDSLTAEERKALGKVGRYAPNYSAKATLLGTSQMNWLKKQLAKTADVRLICSSIQVIPNEKGMDEWGNYPIERQAFLDLISASSGTSVLLSGNVHFAEISRLRNSGKNIYEITSSGLTHINEQYGEAPNNFRVKGPYIDLNYGEVKIDWNLKQIVLNIKGLESTIESVVVPFNTKP